MKRETTPTEGPKWTKTIAAKGHKTSKNFVSDFPFLSWKQKKKIFPKSGNLTGGEKPGTLKIFSFRKPNQTNQVIHKTTPGKVQ